MPLTTCTVSSRDEKWRPARKPAVVSASFPGGEGGQGSAQVALSRYISDARSDPEVCVGYRKLKVKGSLEIRTSQI